MNSLFLTDRGKIRNLNEDAGGIFSNKSGHLLAIVADGMGGHNAGDVASELTIDLLAKKWKDIEDQHLKRPGQFEQWLHNVIIEVNRIVYDRSKDQRSLHGMGTTIVAAICTDEFITIAHIGDSRCYLSNKKGFKQLTEDHSLVNELVRVGQIKEEDAEQHPRKNVLLKALGTEEIVKPDVQTINWEKDDQLLICSDGLTNKINNNELQQILQQEGSIDAIGNKLVNLANKRGGEDNISLVLIRYECPIETGETTC